MAKVFVYGSLREGLHNHDVLHQGEVRSERVGGRATTRAGEHWALLSLGAYPAMVWRGGGPEGMVVGEVWEVSAETLRRLDVLEGVRVGLYRRESVLVDVEGLGVAPACWAYTMGDSAPAVLGRETVPGGDWAEWLRKRGEEGWGRGVAEVVAKNLRGKQ